MGKIILAVIFLISIHPIYCQKYDTKYIIYKADSILHKVVGDSLYKYFTYDTNSYYEYIDESGKTSWETLNEFPETKGDFVEIDVRFDFIYPLIEEIRGFSSVRFDKELIFKDSIYLDFIPDFLKENRKCDFISSERALEIAKNIFTHEGEYEIDASLNYNSNIYRYVYYVNVILKKYNEETDDEFGYIEYVIVDALNGEVLEHQFGQYIKRMR